MMDVNLLAVLAAAIVAFVVGAVWNSSVLFGEAYAKLAGLPAGADQKMPVGSMLAELVRVLITAFVLAQIIAAVDVSSWTGAVAVAAAIWLGFQATLLAGAVIWERMPLQLYAIHTGDALVKALLMGLIIGVWR